jgi:hypothetical protein
MLSEENLNYIANVIKLNNTFYLNDVLLKFKDEIINNVEFLKFSIYYSSFKNFKQIFDLFNNNNKYFNKRVITIESINREKLDIFLFIIDFCNTEIKIGYNYYVYIFKYLNEINNHIFLLEFFKFIKKSKLDNELLSNLYSVKDKNKFISLNNIYNF